MPNSTECRQVQVEHCLLLTDLVTSNNTAKWSIIHFLCLILTISIMGKNSKQSMKSTKKCTKSALDLKA